jgi:hypothetical protein
MAFVPIMSYLNVKRVTVSQSIPELRFVETDQADPAGRFRLRTEGGKFLLEKKTNVGADWTTWEEVMEINADTDTVDFFGAANP